MRKRTLGDPHPTVSERKGEITQHPLSAKGGCQVILKVTWKYTMSLKIHFPCEKTKTLQIGLKPLGSLAPLSASFHFARGASHVPAGVSHSHLVVCISHARICFVSICLVRGVASGRLLGH